MSIFQKERLENAICYFSKEWKRRTERNLPSMGLYKLLAFMDFWGVENHGRPVFDLTYLAMRMGPVPREIYNNRQALGCPLFEFIEKGEGKFEVVSKGDPEMELFSEAEAEKMSNMLEIYGDPAMTTALFSEASHQEIMAWRRAFNERPNQPIDYKLMFPGDIEQKNLDDLEPIEEAFLVHRAILKMG